MVMHCVAWACNASSAALVSVCARSVLPARPSARPASNRWLSRSSSAYSALSAVSSTLPDAGDDPLGPVVAHALSSDSAASRGISRILIESRFPGNIAYTVTEAFGQGNETTALLDYNR